MTWNTDREKMLQLYVRQMWRSSVAYSRATRVMTGFKFALKIYGLFASAYTAIVPASTLGCAIDNGDVCTALQWSSVVVAILGSICAGLDVSYDPAGRVVKYGETSRTILKIARRIDFQLQKSRENRVNADEFLTDVLEKFEAATDRAPLPGFLLKAGELPNMSLLRSFQTNPSSSNGTGSTSTTSSSKSADGDRRESLVLGAPEMTATDRAVLKRIEYQMGRLADEKSAEA